METNTLTPVSTIHDVTVKFAFGADWKAECSCHKWYRLGYRHQQRAVRAAEAHAVEHGGTVKVVTR